MTDLKKLGEEHGPGQLPPVGTHLKATHKGKDYTAEIVQDKEADRPMVKLGGKLFRSLSTAAASVTGHAMNGWTFFGLKPIVRPAGATPGPERPKPKASKRAGKNAAPKAGARKAIRCGEKGCKEMFANTADATAHLVEAHPKR